MSPQEQQARLDGQFAALRKQAFTDNPHPLSTSVCRAWSKGWNEIAEQQPKRVPA